MPLDNNFVITFSRQSVASSTQTMGGAASGKSPWVPWYSPKNDEPDQIAELILKNNLNAGILRTKVDFVVGKGIVAYYENIVNGKRERSLIEGEWTEWISETNFQETVRRCATDLEWFGNFFTEFIARNDNKVASVHHLDATRCRLARYDAKGNIPYIYHCTDWAKPRLIKGDKDGNMSAIPTSIKEDKFAKHYRNYVPGYAYYSPPSWIGCRNYILLANAIPEFHANGLRNGYHLKYHIIVPQSYIDAFPANEKDQRKAELRDNMDKFLSGAENAGKAFMSFARSMDNKNFEEWKIIPLENKLNDSAYTALFDQTNAAIISGHGIDPTLCGIETAGKLSSGSEKRIAAQIYQEWKTAQSRQLLLQPLELVKAMNKWPANLKFGFEDVQITTLDKNPMGAQNTVS